ncbi:MAG: lamin tail domain-containing protein, partial [Phycisphaeraceae bacterium]|nr:lamin tail domain-containing protein [Phycisphaeraceae bacterium]
MMQSRVNRQFVYVLLLGIAAGLGQRTVNAQWTAYNDCLRESGDSTAVNVTGWTIHNQDQAHNTGPLINHTTGSPSGMPTVTFTMGSAGISVSSGGSGGNAQPGTEAHDLFWDLIDFGPNVVYYGRPGWWVEIEFSGLNPDSTYAFAGTAIRSYDYPDRISQLTLLGAASAVNNSSDGVADKLPDTTLLIAGDNSVTGYVVRWDDIKPSLEGTFRIRAEATAKSDSGKAYPLGGFLLSESTDGSGPQGLEVDAGQYDALPWPLQTVRLYPTVDSESPDDLNGLIYTWSQLTGPHPVTFDPSEAISDPNVIFPDPGEYEFELTVENQEGLQGTARVTITVLEPGLVGDLDGNRRVNWRDLELFTALWLDPSENLSNLDAQGPVNFLDMAMLSENWGEGENITLVINEVLARNDLFNTDPQNEYEDWIEIMNVGDTVVDLAGMYLTDDLSAPTLWRFPSDRISQTLLAPGYRVLVWADGDVKDSDLHAAFQLSADQGGHVGLFAQDGVTLIDSLEFGPQTPDVSFGHDPDGLGLLTTLRPTPGQSNNGAILPVVDAMVFSVERGFYESPVQVAVSAATPGVTIRYTLDGSNPSEQRGW